MNYCYNINSVIILILFVYSFKSECQYFDQAILVGMMLLLARQEIRTFDFEETKKTLTEPQYYVFIVVQCLC